LSAFLKKLVEILISCEDKKADWIGEWIREEGYMEGMTSYLVTCHTTNVFGIRNFYSATSVKMRRALSVGHSNRGSVSSETKGETCGRSAAER